MENSDKDIAPNSERQEISDNGKGYQIDAKSIGRVGDNYYNTELGFREVLYGGIDSIPPSLAKRVDRTLPQRQLQQWMTGREPLISILGQSGFGKSVLAAWSLQQFGREFDRALWVNCATVSSFGQWAGWTLQEIGFLVRDPKQTDAFFAQELMRRLRERRCLLVLDRLEVLMTAADWQSYADFLTDWQRRGQDSTVLLTTQQEIKLSAQWRLVGVEPAEGCLLLEQKGIVDEGQGWRSQLSEAAEGHPLLLNLAASWLRQEKPQAMISAEDLGFFRGLFQRYQGNPEAQVEEVFADLFARLLDGLRQGLMDESVYRIAFDEAMAGVMGLLGVELEGLVEQGFLTMRSEDGRWTLHPLMARLVRNAAKENGRETGAHERAIAFFDSHRQPWTGNLEDCREEFESFYHYCELGRYGDAYQVKATCVDVLDRQGHYRSLVPIYEQLTKAWQPANEAETQNLGWAWTQLGNTYRTLGRYQDSIAAHEQAQQFFQSIAFRQGEAASLGSLGIAYYSLGQYQRAIDFHQQSLEIKREIGDRRGEANSLGSLGIAYYSLGQYQRAIEFHQQN
ncbi:MAG: tetratricopeptide repeat protein, partial [Cyanobacteria bacterium CAN_BIN43]|nr:tetratricopeptide repeat protein [Cyanobacteria bacterium CAN_BIN43]